MLTTASEELGMEIPMDKVVDVWRGGCIIRSALLGVLKSSYAKKGLKNILLDENIAVLLQERLPAMQKIVSLAAGNNYASAGLMASLNYFNSYRRQYLPTNLIQAQRDFFGAHTYQRIDGEGVFHTEWQDGSTETTIK